jgi:ABC-type glutathione transport system ATPase component
MPSFDIVRTHQAGNSFRVQSVIGKFDLQSSEVVERFKGDITIPEHWNVGLIVGASGTGKTTIAKELFPTAYFDGYEYIHSSVIDDMPERAKMDEVTRMLNSVGFSSPPSWLKPYSVLSNGQKMRVDMARALLMDEPLVVFDEFTSVVDRQVAQVGSYAVQKAVRKANRQFIAVGCHYDVEDWLLPDWVFDTNSMTFREGAKKKDQTSASRYSRQETKAHGKCLLDITI